MLDKKGTYALLDKYKFIYEGYEHLAVYSIEELDTLNIPHKEQIVKNLFLRDDKKKDYFLVTIPGYKSVNLKTLRDRIHSRKLSFASEEDLWEMLRLKRGHVTPIGILNNVQKNVTAVFDNSLRGQQIGIHPMENTATVFLAFELITKLVEDHGYTIVMCEFD